MASRRALVLFFILSLLGQGAPLFAANVPLCVDASWGYDNNQLRCPELATELYYDLYDYQLIVDAQHALYYLPSCENPWVIIPDAGPVGQVGYACKTLDGVTVIDPLDTTYLNLIDSAWLASHAGYYIPVCNSSFSNGGRGGEGAVELRCANAAATQISVSDFASQYVTASGGGLVFLYCEGGTWSTGAGGEPLCSGSLTQYTTSQLAEIVRNQLVSEGSMLSVSDFEVLLLASIVVLFTAWSTKRVIALIR